MALIDERVTHFTKLLENEAKRMGLEKVEAFKEKVLSNYISANLLSSLEQKLGPQAEAFLQYIKKDFNEQKKALLEGITIKDDIETIIAKS